MSTKVRPHPDEDRDAPPEPVSPENLVARHIENARDQLAVGREHLKRARRRVVQLEDALGNWERLGAEVRAKAHRSER